MTQERERTTWRPERPPSAPTSWEAIDPAVEQARKLAVDLHGRSRKASDEARTASEKLAEVEANDRRRRSEALAAGKRDPGRDDKTIAHAERNATAASETSALLSDAYLTAMRRLDATCAERSEAWEAQARERLDAAVSTSVEALDSVEAGYRQWVAASRQVALATDARTRRKVAPPSTSRSTCAPAPRPRA